MNQEGKMMLKRIIYGLFLTLKQKSIHAHQQKVRYLFEKGKNQHLVVIFSGFPQENQKAKYNYIKTLKHVNANKLFILDDIGPNQRGAYYLGYHHDFSFALAVETLILKVKKDYHITKVIHCGSSKGGYAAMYFALRTQGDVVISGAQQYYLGNYLFYNHNKPIYTYLTGSDDEKDVGFLNNLLKDSIELAIFKPRVYLHYSIHEHTYHEHIHDLIMDLRKHHFPLDLDEHGYEHHHEVANYFPKTMLNVIQRILSEDVVTLDA